jgi:hypothetical protein
VVPEADMVREVRHYLSANDAELPLNSRPSRIYSAVGPTPARFSVQTRTRLYRQSNRSLSEQPIPAWKGFGEARDWTAIFADDFARQRLGSRAFPSPKPREVKDYSRGTAKPDLRRTAWWRRQSLSDRSVPRNSRLTVK